MLTKTTMQDIQDLKLQGLTQTQIISHYKNLGNLACDLSETGFGQIINPNTHKGHRSKIFGRFIIDFASLGSGLPPVLH